MIHPIIDGTLGKGEYYNIGDIHHILRKMGSEQRMFIANGLHPIIPVRTEAEALDINHFYRNLMEDLRFLPSLVGV